jgi:hypothetical protein
MGRRARMVPAAEVDDWLRRVRSTRCALGPPLPRGSACMHPTRAGRSLCGRALGNRALSCAASACGYWRRRAQPTLYATAAATNAAVSRLANRSRRLRS